MDTKRLQKVVTVLLCSIFGFLLMVATLAMSVQFDNASQVNAAAPDMLKVCTASCVNLKIKQLEPGIYHVSVDGNFIGDFKKVEGEILVIQLGLECSDTEHTYNITGNGVLENGTFSCSCPPTKEPTKFQPTNTVVVPTETAIPATETVQPTNTVVVPTETAIPATETVQPTNTVVVPPTKVLVVVNTPKPDRTKDDEVTVELPKKSCPMVPGIITRTSEGKGAYVPFDRAMFGKTTLFAIELPEGFAFLKDGGKLTAWDPCHMIFAALGPDFVTHLMKVSLEGGPAKQFTFGSENDLNPSHSLVDGEIRVDFDRQIAGIKFVCSVNAQGEDLQCSQAFAEMPARSLVDSGTMAYVDQTTGLLALDTVSLANSPEVIETQWLENGNWINQVSPEGFALVNPKNGFSASLPNALSYCPNRGNAQEVCQVNLDGTLSIFNIDNKGNLLLMQTIQGVDIAHADYSVWISEADLADDSVLAFDQNVQTTTVSVDGKVYLTATGKVGTVPAQNPFLAMIAGKELWFIVLVVCTIALIAYGFWVLIWRKRDVAMTPVATVPAKDNAQELYRKMTSK